MSTQQEVVYWPADPAEIIEEAGTRLGTHYGIDFALPQGHPLIAPISGHARLYNDGAHGKLPGTNIKANGPALIIDIISPFGQLFSRFAHVSGYAVKQGQWVEAGQVVAYVGDTGFSTGPHLHWEMRRDNLLGEGRWINPRNFNPQAFEEDDMYTNEDRKRDDETRWLAEQTKNAADEALSRVKLIHTAVDIIKWALVDAKAGLREAVALLDKKVSGMAEALKKVTKQ